MMQPSSRPWWRPRLKRSPCQARRRANLSKLSVLRLLAGMVLVCACGSDRSARSHDSQSSDAGDNTCLQYLREQKVRFASAPPLRGVRTPVEPRGPINGIRLTPRGGLAAVMDCELLRALYEAAPTIARAGVNELSFSGAYVYRTRHRSNILSAHSYGLAIDVHALRGPGGDLDITRDFEKNRRAWRELKTRDGDMNACVGSARTGKARRLRRLACELKHHSAFRVIITPDDDADHRDHIHIETFSDPEARVARVMGAF